MWARVAFLGKKVTKKPLRERCRLVVLLCRSIGVAKYARVIFLGKKVTEKPLHERYLPLVLLYRFSI